jgi:serine/threonine protein kinase
MELVRGSTIKDWQRRPLRTADEIIHAYAQAGDALAATHADGLLHRDFKPTNVLVGRGGRAVLIDYGLARRTTEPGDASMRASGPLEVDDELDVDVTQTGMTIGTPAYMSPEQIRCERLDARSDQFSFCVALYEALMGRRPFAGATSRHVMEAIVFGRRARVVPKREVPRRVRQVIERGLSADRDARYPNMNALLADLRAAVAN